VIYTQEPALQQAAKFALEFQLDGKVAHKAGCAAEGSTEIDRVFKHRFWLRAR
jgi:hypothetical protein